MRRIVLLSGLGLTFAGVVAVTSLPVAASWRTLAGMAWMVIGLREVHGLARSYRLYRTITVDSDGGVEVRGAGQDPARGKLLAGSIVLPGLAWLRIGLADGPVCAELLRGNTGQYEAWRRLQVIWRHLGAAL